MIRNRRTLRCAPPCRSVDKGSLREHSGELRMQVKGSLASVPKGGLGAQVPGLHYWTSYPRRADGRCGHGSRGNVTYPLLCYVLLHVSSPRWHADHSRDSATGAQVHSRVRLASVHRPTCRSCLQAREPPRMMCSRPRVVGCVNFGREGC